MGMYNQNAGNINALYHHYNNATNLLNPTLRHTQYIHTYSLRGILLKPYFTYVGSPLNSIQFFFISRAGKITKVCFKMYYKKHKTSVSAEDNIT